jgi:hypothetical protein
VGRDEKRNEWTEGRRGPSRRRTCEANGAVGCNAWVRCGGRAGDSLENREMTRATNERGSGVARGGR